jgi:glycosyltransferase involved in cell wall biosynthesis
MNSFEGRVGIVQRVLPRYRAELFDMLAKQCKGGLGVFAGTARPGEHIPIAEKLDVAKWTRAENQHLFNGPLYLCLQKNLLEWLPEWEPDVLIVEANPRYLTTSAAIELMKNRFRPVIGWGLGAPKPRGLLAGLQLFWRKRFLKQFDAMIAYSQRGAAEYRSLGFPSDRVFVAPNAAVARPIKRPTHRKDKMTDQLTVLSIGRLQKRKRLEALINACAALPKAMRLKLQIVGDGPIREELHNLAKKTYPQSEFLGARFGRELDAIFDQADLFVLPGTGGLAIQQAMAHGLPVIAAEGDGSQEDLVQPANGWLIKPNDDKALQRTLEIAVSDPKRLRSMGEKSFELVQKEFNLETMVDAFVNAIKKVSA